VARREGDYPAAHSFYARGLLILREGACRGLAVCCVEGLVAVAVAMGQFEQAARLIGATEPLWVPDTEPLPLPSNLRSDYEAHLATVRAALGEEAFAAALAAGQRLAPEEAIDLALAEAHPAAS
jgi:hypothetical protein